MIKLIVIDFTAFNTKGERQFVNDHTNKDGDGQYLSSTMSKQKAIEYIKSICYTAIIHKVTEYDLQVIKKEETIY